jgi:hypothetical protein
MTNKEGELDETQLRREYSDFSQYHVNPPSFETWKEMRDKNPTPHSLSEYRRLTIQGLPVPKPEVKSRSEQMREAGFTRRPFQSIRSFPSDE